MAVLLAAGAACSDVRDVAERQFDSGTPGTLVVAAEVPDPGFWEGAVDEINGGFEYGLATAWRTSSTLGSRWSRCRSTT